MNKKSLFWIAVLCVASLVIAWIPSLWSQATQTATSPSVANGCDRPDIITAVKAAAGKDCGCGQCAAKGCDPCHGKNCYYCAAKGLVAMECGCMMCSSKGCTICGPGCDVCKFHLAPADQQKSADEPKQK